MTSRVLEGTVTEIQRQLADLPVGPEDRLSVTVTTAAPLEVPLRSDPARFKPTEFRNGVPLLPRRTLDQPVDLNLVKRIDEAEDAEYLGAG